MSSIYLKTLTCNEETNEVGSDEPYVLVTSVNLASSVVVAGFSGADPVLRCVPFWTLQRCRLWRLAGHRRGRAVLLGRQRRLVDNH